MYILICHSDATEKKLLQWIHETAKGQLIDVKEVVCDRGDLVEVLRKEAADKDMIGIVAMDNAGKAALQIHDVPKMLINPVLAFSDEEERKRVMRSATSFDSANTWGIFSSEGDNEEYYETMHLYCNNLALQFGDQINKANAYPLVSGFLSEAVEIAERQETAESL
ncbi:MAG: hypothetical protein ACI4B3_00880 [Prevotella sp.]